MASPVDLVPLDFVKSYIGNAANVGDTKVAQIITAVSTAIARYTDCTILPKSYVEVRDGNPRGIMLRNWPVISVESVIVGGTTTLSPLPSNGGPSCGHGYIIDTPDDPQASTPQMLRAPYGGIWKGVGNVAIAYTAGYQVAGEAQTVPPPAPGGTTSTVTASQPLGAWGADRGVSYGAGGALLAVEPGFEAQGRYSVVEGVYAFAAADAGASVLLTYGYVPADLANACLEWIQDRLAYQSRVGEASKSIGGQETTAFKVVAMPDFVKAMLQPYVNVVPIT